MSETSHKHLNKRTIIDSKEDWNPDLVYQTRARAYEEEWHMC